MVMTADELRVLAHDLYWDARYEKSVQDDLLEVADKLEAYDKLINEKNPQGVRDLTR